VSAAAIEIDAASAAQTAGVEYPVYVDPDWTGGETAWTFVDARYPTASYWLGSNHGTDNEAHVGYIDAAHCGCSDGAHTDRTFWQFDTRALAGKHVLSARFNAVQIYSAACTSNAINLNTVGAISASTTWNTQPPYYWNISQATVGAWRSGCGNNQSAVGWDAFKLADYVAVHNTPTATVGLQAANEADYTTWRRFDHDVTLTVSYNSYPNTPSNPLTNNQGCSTSAPGPSVRNIPTSKVTLAVGATDPDAGQTLRARFWVATAGGTNVMPAPGYYDTPFRAQGSSPMSAVPTTLASGNYRWRAQTFDGTDWSTNYSLMCYFTIDNTAPSQPLVVPATTDAVPVGSQLSVSLDPRGTGEEIMAYAWTWQTGLSLPASSGPPSCGPDTGDGGIHLVCGSSLDLTVAPPTAGTAQLKVWAFDAAGNASLPEIVDISTTGSGVAALAPLAHRWTTDVGGPPAPAECPPASGVSCVPDDRDRDATTQPNGQYPIPLPTGVTLGGNGAPGSFVAPIGVLNFDATSGVTTTGAGVVVDTTESFTVAGWLTPTVDVSGVETAISTRGSLYSGFRVGITADNHWQFGVYGTASGTGGTAVAGSTVSHGEPVYVAGVWDAVNHEIRLYLNGSGSPAAVTRYLPNSDPTADQGLTLGSGWTNGAAVERWTGQIGNPIVVQGVVSDSAMSDLFQGVSPFASG
jgi:hypothetical protein